MWLGIPIFFYTKQFWQGESLQLNPGRSFRVTAAFGPRFQEKGGGLLNEAEAAAC
jgi:hypothetical protein